MNNSFMKRNEKSSPEKGVFRRGLEILGKVVVGVGAFVGAFVGVRMGIEWLGSLGEESVEWASAVPEDFAEWNAELLSAVGTGEFDSEAVVVLNALYGAAPDKFAAWMDAKVALPPVEFATLEAAAIALYQAAPEGWKRWENAILAWDASPTEQNESELIDSFLALEAVAPTQVDAYLIADTELTEGWPEEVDAYRVATQELMNAAPLEFANLSAYQRGDRGQAGY